MYRHDDDEFQITCTTQRIKSDIHSQQLKTNQYIKMPKNNENNKINKLNQQFELEYESLITSPLNSINPVTLYSQYIQQYINTLYSNSSCLFSFSFHQMQLQTIPRMQKLTFESPKYIKKTLNDSFRTDTEKFHHTQNFEDQQFNQEKFTKTHFKTKIKQLNSSKYSVFEDSQSNSESQSLWRIEEKLKKQSICSERQKQFLLTKAQRLKFPGLQTNKNARFKSAKADSVDQQRQRSQDIDARPLTLKRHINMIKKHKEIIQKQFQQRKASLQYNQRALSKQQFKLQCYKSKFNKVKTVREQRSKQKIQNSLEIAMHNQQIQRRNYFLKSTVLECQDNLKNSRMSLCMQKIKQANQTRVQKHLNMQEVRSYENQTFKQKKQQCEEVKNIKARTHQSVEDCNNKRIITVNQRKLQEISKELVSLEYQKKTHNRFYRTNEVNDSYQNKIKNKKVQLQQKAKVYKTSLMLELNKSQKIIHHEEQPMVKVRNSSITQPYTKKQEVQTSTAADLNFASTKSNCIYKRWNNPMIAERLRTEPSA